MAEYNASKIWVSKKEVDKILRIQRNCYKSEYIEGREIFERMIDVYPRGCIGVLVDTIFAGYIFFHPYFEGRPKPLNTMLRLNGKEDCMYLHDLAIDRKYRGRGLSKILMDEFNQETQKKGFKVQCLVSVQDSLGFWEKHGFKLDKIIKDYGYENAYYMKRSL